MQETTNLKLKKPELTDAPPDITVLDHNWDTLDTEVNDLQENKADKNLTANKELTNVTNSDFRRKAQVAGIAVEVKEVNTNYTLTLDNAGDLLKCTNTNDITITVPTDTDVDFPIGTEIELIRYGAGDVAVDAPAGVTIINPNNITPPDINTILKYKGNDRILTTQFTSIVLKKIGVNDWFLIGDVYRIKSLIATIKSSGDWTVPAGITSVDVYLVCGGGGGGYGLRGGGGGGYCKLYKNISLIIGNSYACVIGAGGARGTSSTTTGGAGGTSSFNSIYTATGGSGGSGSSGGNGGSGGGGSGTSSGGDGGSNGSNGQSGSDDPGGSGGGTIDYTPTNPYNNTLYGGGGGGGSTISSGSGGSGGSGIILIYG
ncbi:MAG: glycine-rich domain-containing protein [Bacillota bacterium]